jgi:hypothetical protein
LESKGSHLFAVEKLAETTDKKQITGNNLNFRTDSQLLVVQRKDLSKVHVLHMGRDKCLSEPRYDMGIIGHATNTACFFCGKYYRKAPVAALRLLAAHMIITAGKLNPHGIQGLDILTCTTDGFAFATLNETVALEKRSQHIDDQLSQLLMNLS